MPILDQQIRMRQLGEIRIGHVVEMDNGKTRPAKLDKFRFTSPSEAILTAVASAFGGDVKPWTPANGGASEYEVYTEANRIPVIIPPTAVTQWYELYQGSKCVRRCDGRTEHKSDDACKCNPERRDCAMTTRLNVMLADVPPLGLWLLTSRGYYAAMELPPIADLLARGGGHVPGWLGVEERRIVRDRVNPKAGQSPTETIRFMVPTLDIDLSPSQILSGSGGVGAPQIGAGAATVLDSANGGNVPLAIEAKGPTAQMFADTALGAPDADTLREIYKEANAAGLLDEIITVVGKTGPLHEMLSVLAKQYVATGPTPPAPEDAKTKVTLWTQCMGAAPTGWSTENVLSDWYGRHSCEPAEGTVEELSAFLVHLQNVGPEPEPEAPMLEQPSF